MLRVEYKFGNFSSLEFAYDGVLSSVKIAVVLFVFFVFIVVIVVFILLFILIFIMFLNGLVEFFVVDDLLEIVLFRFSRFGAYAFVFCVVVFFFVCFVVVDVVSILFKFMCLLCCSCLIMFWMFIVL